MPYELPLMIQQVLQALAPFTPLGPAAAVAGATAGVLNLIENRKRSKREVAERALGVIRAIKEAVEATDNYLQYRATHAAKVEWRERELVLLWRVAGLELEVIAKADEEKKLAKLLREKSFAWDYTKLWPEGRLVQHGLDFESVKKRTSEVEEALRNSVT